MRVSGITPMTSPPACSTVSASLPIKPTLAPPYTSPRPRATRVWPSSTAAWAKAGERPGLEPQKTQIRRMRLILDGARLQLDADRDQHAHDHVVESDVLHQFHQAARVEERLQRIPGRVSHADVVRALARVAND